jgi:hypothetical protein
MILDPAVNAMSAYTGFTFTSTGGTNLANPASADPLLDVAVSQLAKGIPTPLRVSDAVNSGGHFILCTAVQGSGPSQQFLIHDPWSGDTNWFTRQQLDSGQFSIAGWTRVSHAYVATAAPLPVPTPPVKPA